MRTLEAIKGGTPELFEQFGLGPAVNDPAKLRELANEIRDHINAGIPEIDDVVEVQPNVFKVKLKEEPTDEN